jgi:hypothetical protein
MMDEEELEFFKNLPDEITIYRGYRKRKNKKGLSWTLSKERAEWFSRRFARTDSEAAVVKRVVKKSQVLAYFNGRKEDEILLKPEFV